METTSSVAHLFLYVPAYPLCLVSLRFPKSAAASWLWMFFDYGFIRAQTLFMQEERSFILWAEPTE
jgi:hypothetical protein